jgi:hypothetical protein
MKKLLFGILMISMLNVSAQDWSTVYRQVEEVTLNEGLENEYIEFEAFWKTIKEKHVKEGMQVGWFVWKVVPTEENKGWSDYLIFNIYANKKQMNDMNSKSPEWWENEIKTAHKGKTKRSIIKKYTQETMDNKYRQKSVSYTNKSLETFLSEEATPEAGTKGTYIGVEQLNEDYVDFETKLFLPYHKETKSRLYWELNEIVDRSENAYKPVTHTIFEIMNPESAAADWNPSFAEEMAVKYGTASRKFHGSMNVKLVHFAW